MRSKATIKQRGQSWQVDFGRKKVDGKIKRERKTYKTKAEATAAIAERKIESKNNAVSLSGISDHQRWEIRTAIEKLAGRGTITQAVDFYLEHSARPGAKTIEECLSKYIESKNKANLRPRTIAEVKGKLGAFATGRESTGVHEVTAKDLEAWLDGRGYTPETRNCYRRQLHAFFNFAIKNKWRTSNPAKAIEISKTDDTFAAIHTAKQVEAMLRASAKIEPLTVPYFAIGYLGGLRPENELAKLDWSDIDFDSGLIRVRAETAKMRRERYVKMSENLMAWLAPYRQKSGAIGYRRKRCYRVRAEAQVEWSSDVMRHTFASMHLVQHDDAGKTALQMGHKGDDVLFNHYREILKPKEAAKFWAIMPKAKGKVVRFKKAG